MSDRAPYSTARPDLYRESRRNQWRAAVIVTAPAAVLALVGAVVVLVAGLGLVGIVVVLVLVAGLAGLAYTRSDAVALALTRARPADGPDVERFQNVVEGLCIAAGLPKPRLYVVDDEAPNAFAAGRNPKHAALAVTTGLLQKLNRVELEGVVAHELSDIKSYDVLPSTVAVVAIGPLALLLAPAGVSLMRLAMSPDRELLADASGVQLTRYPPGLASALKKLRADPAVVRHASRATAPLWIEAPLEHGPERGSRRVRAFDTQPPLDQRIKALESM
jgi:heat shock protein HtpX